MTVFHNQFDDKIATGVPIANCLFRLTQAQFDVGGYNRSGCYDVGFYTAYISTVPTFGQSVNIDEAVTKGIEATARFRFDDAWTLQGNYTFTDSEQKSGAAAGQPLTDTPEHMLNANLRWNATDRMNLWLRGEYRSSRYRGVGDAPRSGRSRSPGFSAGTSEADLAGLRDQNRCHDDRSKAHRPPAGCRGRRCRNRDRARRGVRLG